MVTIALTSRGQRLAPARARDAWPRRSALPEKEPGTWWIGASSSCGWWGECDEEIRLERRGEQEQRVVINPVSSDIAALECARSLANEAMFTVSLQRRRIRSDDPEDVFVMRRWADL